MKNQNEEVFSEMVSRAKNQTSNQWHSADKAIIWASEEIERLRALVGVQEQGLSDDTIQADSGGLDWDGFNGGEDDFKLGETKPVEAPKACSIDSEGCESCQ